ncbi:hypothetical protein DYB30_010377, partial [Aphanomyces astaci]
MDLPVCPNLHSIAQTEVYRWLIKRKAYEARLEDECRRKNIQFREHVTSYVACFSDKQLLRTMMSIWKIRGEPEDMSEQILKDKLQDIAKKPMNDVDPDLESLFDDIEFNMREEDATMRAADYMTACLERIDVRGAGEFLRTPDIRFRMYTSLLNQLPGKVSEYTKDAFKKKWHPVDFEWGDLIQIVVDISVEQQTYWMRWGAGAGKRSGTKSPKHKKSKHGHDYQNRGEDKKSSRDDGRQQSRARDQSRGRDRSRGRELSRGGRDRSHGREYSRGREESRGYDRSRGRSQEGYHSGRERHGSRGRTSERNQSAYRGSEYSRHRGSSQDAKFGWPRNDQGAKFGTPPAQAIDRNAGYQDSGTKRNTSTNRVSVPRQTRFGGWGNPKGQGNPGKKPSKGRQSNNSAYSAALQKRTAKSNRQEDEADVREVILDEAGALALVGQPEGELPPNFHVQQVQNPRPPSVVLGEDMGIIWMSVSVDYGGEWRSCLAIRITNNVWCDGIRTEFGINQYFHWMTELPILDGRIAHPVQCLFCGDLERLHHFKDCPDIDQDGIDRIKWVWGWRMCGYLRNPKFQKYAKKTAQMRKKMGKKFYRIYMPDDAVNM